MERWKINLYTVWFSQILSMMSFSFGFPFLPFYIQEIGVTDPAQIKIYTALLSTAPAITMAVMAPIWGMVADKWGKKMMLLRAVFFAAIILAVMGMVTNVHQLVVLRFIQGIFTGTVAASSALVASGTPENRLSFSMGFLSSSTFIGSSFGPVIGGFMAEYAGYRISFYTGGLLMFIDFIVVLFLVREERTELPPVPEKDKPGASVFSMFTVLISLMLFVLFILRVSRSVFGPYLPLYVQEMLAGTGGAAKYTGIINGVTGVMTALSGLTLSRLGDKHDKMLLLRIFFAAGIVSAVPLAFAPNLWIFTAVYGIFFYIMGSVEPIAISLTAENTPVERRGLLFGIQTLIGSIGWAISPLLASAVSLKFSVQATLFLIPLTLIPGFAVFFFKFRKSQDRELPA